MDSLAADVPAVDGFFLRDLVELVEDDDAVFGSLDVVVGFDQEALDAGLDVLADVAGLCEGVAVADGERDVELLAEGSGES